MEREGSLPHSQVPATYPYPEPARSSPYLLTHNLHTLKTLYTSNTLKSLNSLNTMDFNIFQIL
jgi:hypothetical protein